MNTIVGWMAQNAILTALLVPIVALACRWFRDRPAVQHLLWAMVLVKLMTPPIVAVPWSLPDSWTSLIASPIRSSAANPGIDVDVTCGAIIDRHGYGVAIDNVPLAVNERPVSDSPATAGWQIGEIAWFALVGVWLAGAAVGALIHGRRIAKCAAVVRAGGVAPAELIAEVGAVAHELGMRAPGTVVSAGIMSPFVWCLGPVRMVWPALMLAKADIARSRGVIAHELAHLRRRDHWMAWLEFLARIVWWWNPVYWFIRRRLRETSEMACDAVAIGMRPEQRREYAEMLLELSTGSNAWGGQNGMPTPVLGVSAGTPSSFERRLFMICSERVSDKMTLAGVFFALGIAAASLPGRPLDAPSAVAADEPVVAQNAKSNDPKKVVRPMPIEEPRPGIEDLDLGQIPIPGPTFDDVVGKLEQELRKIGKAVPGAGNSQSQPPLTLPSGGGAWAFGSASGSASGSGGTAKATAKAGVGRPGESIPASPSSAGVPGTPRAKVGGGSKGPVTAKASASGGNAEATAVSVNNDEFTIKHEAGSLKVSIAGKRDGGQTTPAEITIEDNGTSVRAQSLQQVPQRFMPVVNRLLDNVK
jgi:beta-lactamase regulating signal transducer with metallopeptidase domain